LVPGLFLPDTIYYCTKRLCTKILKSFPIFLRKKFLSLAISSFK
jgi:hypothetical protein